MLQETVAWPCFCPNRQVVGFRARSFAPHGFWVPFWGMRRESDLDDFPIIWGEAWSWASRVTGVRAHDLRPGARRQLEV